ncbi:MAG: substrate-binding domain-containing protein [Christensenellales bacterium]|jgi:putative multiple sugar transport system substrate-binding protein
MKRSLAIVLAIALVFVAVACAAPADSSQKAPQGSTGDKKTVGICMPTKEQTIWPKQGDALIERLTAAGFDTMIEFAEDATERQVMQIENMLMKGVDYLIITPVDGSTLTDSVEKAKKQGVTVISSDRLILNTKDVDYYITFDLKNIGTVQATYIEESLGLKEGKGPFNLEIFSGSPDDPNSIPFYEGAMEVLKPYIDSGKLVVKSGQIDFNVNATQAWSGTTAQARMDNLLSSYYSDDKVDAVLVAADCLSVGVVSSLNSIGYGSEQRPYPVMTGSDCELTAIEYIKDGKMSMTILVDPNLFADLAVDVIVALESGQPLEHQATYNNAVVDVPTYQYETKVIDKDNWEYLIEIGIYTEDELK